MTYDLKVVRLVASTLNLLFRSGRLTVRSSTASEGTESSRWMREGERRNGEGKRVRGERRERDEQRKRVRARVEDTTSLAANCNFVVRSL